MGRAAVIGVPIPPRRVYGVSLSAAADAGNRTWLCRASPGAAGLRVERVDRLAALPGGGIERDAALRALAARLGDAPRSAWGIDAPFGLATESGGCRKTDEGLELGPDAAPGESASGLVTQLLSALRAQPTLAVLPMDPLPVLPPGAPAAMQTRLPSTYVLEVSPGRLLLSLTGTEEGDFTMPHDTTADRERLLRQLVAAKQVRPVPRAQRSEITAHRGALGALLCAVAAWRGYRINDHRALHADPAYRAEGFCYC